MGMALLYAVLRLDGDPDKCDAAWCAAAIDDVEKCQAYLRSFCKGWPHTRRLSHTFDCFAARAIAQLQIHFASPSGSLPAPLDLGTLDAVGNPKALGGVGELAPEPTEDTWAGFLGPDKQDGGDVDALLAMLGWNAEWLPELLPNFQSVPLDVV